MGSESRRSKQVLIRLSPEELKEIELNAKSCGLTKADYLRKIGAGYSPKGVIDQLAVNELIKVAGDLGRLGGLLKLLLTERENLLHENLKYTVGEVHELLGCISYEKDKLKSKIMNL